ncbi:hypothetical protein [Priestia aryabhattai]
MNTFTKKRLIIFSSLFFIITLAIHFYPKGLHVSFSSIAPYASVYYIQPTSYSNNPDKDSIGSFLGGGKTLTISGEGKYIKSIEVFYTEGGGCNNAGIKSVTYINHTAYIKKRNSSESTVCTDAVTSYAYRILVPSTIKAAQFD